MNTLKNMLKIIKNDGLKVFIKKIYFHFNNQEKKDYYKWIKNNTPSRIEIKKQRKYSFTYMPKISIVIPLYNTPKKYLLELIKYVKNQTYSNWELCLADGSTEPLNYLNNIISKDERIKYKILEKNKGISGNTNEALKLATGNYIALLDHDDLIPINSLYEIVRSINKTPEADFIFTDEDKFTNMKRKTRYEPNFKPDYSFDTFTSYNYICHFSILKRELMNKLVGFKEEFNGSQDYDLILRAVENAKKIVHIPQILYHWRVHQNSTAGNAESKPYCFDAGKRAVQEHLKRKGLKNAIVEYGVAIVRNRVVYNIQREDNVKIILYIRDNRINLKKLYEDINQITYKNYSIVLFVTEEISVKEDYKKIIHQEKIVKCAIVKEKNLSKEINHELKKCNENYIIIAKDIQDIKTKNFIEQLLGFSQRNDTGVISPRIIHKYTSSQYNGTVYGIDNDKIGYLDYIDVAGSFGYVTRGAVVQNYSIIKSECIMISRKNLETVNYLDENMDYSDAIADISFELFKKQNKLNVINPHIELETLEITNKYGENNFFKKWKEELKIPDPNYNINLRFDKNNLFKVKQEKIKDIL